MPYHNPNFGVPPFNQNKQPSLSPLVPGTNTVFTRSFAERQLTAEFDDALLDQKSWKNPRYEGSKLTAAEINKFTTGDTTYQNLPVIQAESTAIYIANTVIGGEEDPQFATIKDHAYVGISKILVVDKINKRVEVINQETTPFNVFHRFITTDFPTGSPLKAKIIDESIQTNLKKVYRVKMNKGYLLKTFQFKFAGEVSGSPGTYDEENHLTQNNSMYLYTGGIEQVKRFHTGSFDSSAPTAFLGNQTRFRYALIEQFAGSFDSDAEEVIFSGSVFSIKNAGPSFASSSIFENKFTQQYYSGSYGFIKHQPEGAFHSEILASSGLGSASRFIGVDTLNFLTRNNNNPNLSEEEKTELHITFFQGTKDFTSGSGAKASSSIDNSLHDERSIGTFEVDQNIGVLDIGNHCNGGLPTTHELVLKGINDTRFKPLTHTVTDDLINTYLEESASQGCLALADTTILGSVASDGASGSSAGAGIQGGVNIDRVEDAEIYVQGGALGQIGFQGANTASVAAYGTPLTSSMTQDNYYSGSFSYELSFLDKSHTLILDLNKDAELFDGIGQQGLVLIPNNSHPSVEGNLEFYLKEAGLIRPGVTSNPIYNEFTPDATR